MKKNDEEEHWLRRMAERLHPKSDRAEEADEVAPVTDHDDSEAEENPSSAEPVRQKKRRKQNHDPKSDHAEEADETETGTDHDDSEIEGKPSSAETVRRKKKKKKKDDGCFYVIVFLLFCAFVGWAVFHILKWIWELIS
jgi:cobalamin biosynthesis Mg chelatase CobN